MSIPRLVFARRRILLLFISGIYLVFITACSAITEGSRDTSQTIQFTPCQLSAPGLKTSLKAECGKLKVYEDQVNQTGRQIELNIAVIPAISRSPAPDPIFFLAGGPGEAATQSYPSISSAFQLINQKRAIVLVDQRGTGGSNYLTCAGFTDAQEAEISDTQAVQSELKKCLAELNGDPTLYTTSIAMIDLDQVRQALGYEKINLYGASYGTRAALAYVRQFPEHVRSIILDGIVPPNWILGPSVPENAQRALDMLFTRCAADAECQAAFPNLEAEFNDLLKQVTEKPIQVSLIHPISGEPTKFTLDRDTFVNLIHTTTYTAESAALLPLMIHTAHERGDFTQFAALALSNYDSFSNSLSPGMRFSILCAEDVPYFAQEEPTSGYLGDFFSRTFETICKTWPQAQIPADFKQPVSSTVPALLLSGEADPVTPPANGELAAQSLPNSMQIVVPDQGHVVIYRGCIPKIAAKFIDNGSTEDLDTACVQDIKPMPIFTSPNGPPP
jgi:pimeloyl-ACP methyl ester carboxylesterase